MIVRVFPQGPLQLLPVGVGFRLFEKLLNILLALPRHSHPGPHLLSLVPSRPQPRTLLRGNSLCLVNHTSRRRIQNAGLCEQIQKRRNLPLKSLLFPGPIIRMLRRPIGGLHISRRVPKRFSRGMILGHLTFVANMCVQLAF